MAELPRSLPEFEARFPSDAACARWLMAKRWPQGFRCPACGHARAWELSRGLIVLQCAACARQVSVTAGTVLHRSHLPLRTWFLAAWLMATHKNGISARQLGLQLGLGSYKTAWLLVQKLRRAMVAPDREPLAGLVEVDETTIPFRRKDEPVLVKPGRSDQGKLLVAGAVEIKGKAPGRARLTVITDYSAATLGAFVAANIATGSTVVSDGWSGYAKLGNVKHDPKIVGPMAAHVVLPPREPPARLPSLRDRIDRSAIDGCTVSSPTPSAGPWASTTGCAARICNAISTSSSSASIAAMPRPPPSTDSSASAPPSHPPPTRC
jgi:hypothetical protein